MSRSASRILLSLLISVNFFSAGAQDLEIGFAGGGSYYLGDLNPARHFQGTKPAYGFVARYNMDTRWSFRLSTMFGEVTGSSASSTFLPGQSLDFSSKITDISGFVEFNFFPYFTGSYRTRMTPYIYTGFGVFFFDPMSGGVALKPLGTEGQNAGYLGRSPYSTTGFSLPFGLGGKLSVANRLSVQVFWELHKTFTDYLDDVSTTYYLVGKEIDPNDQAARMSDPSMDHTPGMQRGNSGNKDWVAFCGVAVTYKIHLISKKKCRDNNQ